MSLSVIAAKRGWESVRGVYDCRVEGFDVTCICISLARVSVLACRSCCSLVDNSWLIDNSRELRDNVRDKHLNYR